MGKITRNFHVLHRSGNIGTEFYPKEKNIMLTNEPTDGLYPPNVEEPKTNVDQILRDWQDFEGVEPAHITVLRARAGQHPQAKGNDDDGGLYPAGVV